MKNKSSFIVTSILFTLIIFGFAIFGFISKDKDMSISERRKLAQFPKLTVENIFSGDFFKSFDNYTIDQFPERDNFRTINALVRTNLLRQRDSNGLYIENGIVFKSDYPLNKRNIDHFISKTNDVYNTYIKNKAVNYYVSVIPDKGHFDTSDHLNANAAKIAEIFTNDLNAAKYIDIFGSLSLDSYYRTDTHWSQDKLFPVMELMAGTMGFKPPVQSTYITKKMSPFYGVYWGQSALNPEPDILTYLESKYTNTAELNSVDKPKIIDVYDLTAIESEDAYNMFSAGGTALTTITSPNSETEEELVIFRDSFGASIAPLFLEQYRKVTLIDLRYLSSSLLPEYVDFTGKDVLVLYSSLILNSSIQLK